MSGNGETADTIHNIGKTQLADHLRLMADNQKDLDVVNVADQRSRDLKGRIEEAQAKKQFPDLPSPGPPPEADEVKINVDSPTTVTHNYPQPASALAKVALGAALLAGGGAGAGVTALLLNRLSQPPAETTDEDTQYEGGIRVE